MQESYITINAIPSSSKNRNQPPLKEAKYTRKWPLHCLNVAHESDGDFICPAVKVLISHIAWKVKSSFWMSWILMTSKFMTPKSCSQTFVVIMSCSLKAWTVTILGMQISSLRQYSAYGVVRKFKSTCSFHSWSLITSEKLLYLFSVFWSTDRRWFPWMFLLLRRSCFSSIPNPQLNYVVTRNEFNECLAVSKMNKLLHTYCFQKSLHYKCMIFYRPLLQDYKIALSWVVCILNTAQMV